MDTAASDTDDPQLHQLTYKRAQFVTCPACRHGGTTVLAKERLSGWRYVVGTGVTLVFAPLTMGIMLYFLPLVFRPQFVTHSCRRCGLRLAIATAGLGESQYTIPMDVEDHCFVPAPEDWRPDLARLPGGIRVAKSPLGPRPEIPEPEMKVCSKRFIRCHPHARLVLLAGNTAGKPIRCIRAGGNDASSRRAHQLSSSISHRDTEEVLYEIHISNARITVMMRPPPEDAVTEEWPLYSSVMYLPPQSTSGSETAHINNVPPHQRTQFSAAMPIWRWQSSQGGLLWVSRRFRDADMAALETRLCLVDDYGRLVAVLDNWNGVRFSSVEAHQSGGTGGDSGRRSVLTLYADLDAALLGEVLGSLCALALQVWRVTAELKKEKDERRQDNA
ncbi:uncharacterized protein J7T54_002858 [Emericellopsis cladophorae]|uniref:LITAF domain-containing protein n=1 Tax=Emericellopsis cladophorae TaxID=2686198 RepID=A0A9P9XYY6_9HYPO|nr:uncharacterized protein J7T54_002858 [Emericellopsis cladophorae]KAI6780461.1 hypothetical protein J7T54_002858 [Emericellopsis cladophorae]